MNGASPCSDVKPSNILLTDQHEAKLADFEGLRNIVAGDTATFVFGTDEFIDPEYAESKKAPPAADVFRWEPSTCRGTGEFESGFPSFHTA